MLPYISQKQKDERFQFCIEHQDDPMFDGCQLDEKAGLSVYLFGTCIWIKDYKLMNLFPVVVVCLKTDRVPQTTQWCDWGETACIE